MEWWVCVGRGTMGTALVWCGEAVMQWWGLAGRVVSGLGHAWCGQADLFGYDMVGPGGLISGGVRCV